MDNNFDFFKCNSLFLLIIYPFKKLHRIVESKLLRAVRNSYCIKHVNYKTVLQFNIFNSLPINP